MLLLIVYFEWRKSPQIEAVKEKRAQDTSLHLEITCNAQDGEGEKGYWNPVMFPMSR